MNVPKPETIPFDAISKWPDPDMNMTRYERPAAPVMSEQEWQMVFGGWAEWILNAAEVKSAPADYVALALVTAASATIGNTRWAVPWEGWKEPPILWGMLVGDPSAGKSPALDAVLDPIREIDKKLSLTYENKRKEWSQEDEMARLVLAHWKVAIKASLTKSDASPTKPSNAEAGPRPVRERIRITDATTEKVAELLASTWRGLLLSRDELSGWLTSMDRYNGGGDRPFWLEAYGGRSYTVDRKANPEPVVVEYMSTAILGGTQPDKLDRLLVNCDDDGLLARFLIVFPSPAPLKRPGVSSDEQAATTAFERLRNLNGAIDEHGVQRPIFLPFTNNAAACLQTFREQCREWETGSESLVKSHVGKLPGMAVRVATVLALLDWAIAPNGPDVAQISKKHLERACFYVGEHLRGNAHRAYGTNKLPPERKGAEVVAEIIRAESFSVFKVRDIQKKNRYGLGSAKEIRAALSVLLDADWLREIRQDSGGRPSVSYIVNPKLRVASKTIV